MWGICKELGSQGIIFTRKLDQRSMCYHFGVDKRTLANGLGRLHVLANGLGRLHGLTNGLGRLLHGRIDLEMVNLKICC